MGTIIKQEFSWFPENGQCSDTFNSAEDAVKDAQKEYDDGNLFFEDEEANIVNVGPIRRFDFKEAVKSIVEDIEDNIYAQMCDFASGCDIEVESYVPKQDNDKFINEAIFSLLPVVEKYVFTNPAWVCTSAGKYDLKERKWVGSEIDGLQAEEGER